MAFKLFATLLKTSGVASLLFLLLFGESGQQSLPGIIGATAREIAAILRDRETQWMVFLCLGIYFATFLFLRFRTKPAPPDAHPVAVPAFWLVGALVINALLYAKDYSSTTAALAFLFGAVLGQGAGWLGQRSEAGGRKSERNNFTASVVVIFVVLLGLASVWEPEGFRTYEYRGHSRAVGPWDNPNTFGLLMGTGVVLAVGLISAGCRVSGIRREWSVVGKGKSGAECHVSGVRVAIVVLCAVAAFLMARGLFHSYSRGAWLATVCGIGYLTYQVFRCQVAGRWEVKSGKPHLTPASPQTMVYTQQPSTGLRPPSPAPASEGHSSGGGEGEYPLCDSWGSWGRRNFLPLSVIVISVVVIAFWQFRQTEWHPARRALSVANVNDFSWRNRIAAWEGTLQIMAEHPWFGVGWNRPERLYESYYLPVRLTESAAIQMNDYLLLGATLGFPALFCLGMYFWLSLTERQKDRPHLTLALSPPWGSGEGITQTEIQKSETGGTRCPSFPDSSPITRHSSLEATCRAGAIVLLVGFWFDGGMFKLATASTFWILLELGRVDIHSRKATDSHRSTQISEGDVSPFR